MNPSYDFRTQLHIGDYGERILDAHFAHWFTITPASDAEQRQGIDRWYLAKFDGRKRAVEYKYDTVAHRTGNAFVETVSVDTAGKSGWVYTSRADWLMYYVATLEVVYLLDLSYLRRVALSAWEARCRTVTALNSGYRTHGLLVPLSEFERHAVQVVSL